MVGEDAAVLLASEKEILVRLVERVEPDIGAIVRVSRAGQVLPPVAR